MVLRQKGCSNAMTIHQAIYKPSSAVDERLQALIEAMVEATDEDRKAELRQQVMKRRSEINTVGFRCNPSEAAVKAKIIVVDEHGMISQKILDDLIDCTTAKILLLGDPAQLPPVKAEKINLRPDFMLTDIHRQAAENPLLRIANEIRSGQPLRMCSIQNEHGSIVVSDKIPAEDWLHVDQIIVGRNLTRQRINTRMRYLVNNKEAGLPPAAGDKVVLLRNDHTIGVFNGMIGNIVNVSRIDYEPTFFADLHCEDGSQLKKLEFSSLGFGEMNMSEAVDRDYVLADYGYALTCHKAQGSEWDRIGVVVEAGAFDMKPWIYTAITRAKKSCMILLKN